MALAGENARSGRRLGANMVQMSGESGVLDSARRFWRKSYAGDYVGLAALFTGYMVVKMLGTPFHQTFTLNDVRIQHDYARVQRVDTFWLFFCSAGIPLAFILLWTLLWRRSVHKAHVSVLGLAITIFMTLFLTDILKDAIGRPRPDLISRCEPGPTAPSNRLVTIDVCTQTNTALLNDGWRSFPSGHSSFAFAGLGWLALFFASQTRLFRPRASLLEAILSLAPLLGAAMIAISRLEDYRHGPLDVLGGSLLGSLVAWFNWRRYFPSLSSSECDEPFDPPTSRGSSPSGRFSRVRDEEAAFDASESFEIREDVGGNREGRR